MELTIKQLNKETMKIEDYGVSQKWNNDSEKNSLLNKWVKNSKIKSLNIKRVANKNAINFGSLIKPYDENSFGSFVSNGNSCQYNSTLVNLMTTSFNYNGGQFNLYPENFNQVIASYSARSLVPSNWLNNNDEYRVPSEETQSSEKYKQFVNDCHVYSLFSLQSSMRDVPNFDDTTFNIYNHFFWMSNEEMKDLADEHGFNEMYQDADEHYEDRYMYNKLQELELSNDAKDILENLRELVRSSMKWREMAHQEDEKFHLHTWDAGWYQIRMGILKKYMKEELKEFMTKFKAFENRLRPLVYEFGFLPYENKI